MPMEAAADLNTIREQILNAADERFRQFGFNKTTMAEIAKDCGMSAANLYRYFDNKQDICCGLACRCLQEDEDNLKQVAGSDLTPAEKIMAYIRSTFQHTYKQWSESPKMDELVQVVISEHQDYVHQHQETKCHILMNIIQEGVDKGVFEVDDPRSVAESMLMALLPFDVPFFLHLFDYAQMSQKAEDLGRLLLKGLAKK